MTNTPMGLDTAVGPMASADTPKARRWPYLVGAIGLLLIALLAWNATVYIPVASALSDESGATTVAYRRWLVSPDQIVFDVRSVDGETAMVDMDRRLLKAAEALQERSFDSVILAFEGEAKFLMNESYFQEIGATRLTQNPIYTVRTMQEHISNPDGSPAFETWTGGWLGVLGQQLDDHNEFHSRWWVRDALGLQDAGSL